VRRIVPERLSEEVIVQINGIAHIQLAVNDLAKSRAFWGPLFELFEMKVVYDDDAMFYGVGGRTGIGLSPAAPEHRGERFQQGRVGLHHICFRMRAREDVDALHAFLLEHGARVVRAPEDGPWAPGYYSVLFEDPDGVRVEANHVPGKGHLDSSMEVPKRWP
jgi:catechol 2,3-dioxygenase-like lactoylglutathione lyase family enzyme